jgi:hypothetical protein
MPYLPTCSHPFWTAQLKALIAHILCDRANSIANHAISLPEPNISRRLLAILRI